MIIGWTTETTRKPLSSIASFGEDSAGNLFIVSIGGVALTLGWTLLVHAAWGPVSTQMFGGKYGDLGWMVLVWGLCSGLSFVQTALSSALQVMRAFKPIAIANSIAAGAAVLAIVGLMRLYGPAGAVLGTAVGQTIEAVLMVVILRRALRALG